MSEKLLSVAAVAAICHEANRQLCEQIGDSSQVPFFSAPDWQKESAEKGVRFALDNPDATPADQHEAWSSDKLKDGWGYGEVKDPEAKTHPCLVPYHQLPPTQQAKDHLFKNIVEALRPFIAVPATTEDAQAATQG